MKWKFHWGTGLTIVLILFAAMLFTLAYISYKSDRSLVREDYYYHEIHHQNEVDALRRFIALGRPLQAVIREQQLFLEFPSPLAGASLEAQFMRPSDAGLDVSWSSVLDTLSTASFPIHRFRPGKYLLKARIQKDSIEYLTEKEIIIHFP